MISIKELVSEQYYYMESNTWTYISKHDSGFKSMYHIHNKKFETPDEGVKWREDITWNIRLATSDEIEWLELCKKENKYMEKPIKQLYEIY